MSLGTRAKALLLGLTSGVLVIGTLESGARVAHTVRADTLRHEPSWYAYSPDLGWTRRPGFKGLQGGYLREFDAQGFFTADSSQLHDRRTARVVAFGDSNTFGFGAPTAGSFVEVADALLSHVSIINLGVVGATSYQGRAAVTKYLPALEPDLVVVSYNFNDRRAVRSHDTVDSAGQFERIWRASTSPAAGLAAFLQHSYLSRGLRAALTSAGIVASDSQVDLSSTVPRVDEESYRRNLEAIVDVTSRTGIPLVFILLKDNPFQTEALDLGLERLAAHDREGAIVSLQAAVEQDNTFSDLARLHLAEAYVSAGQLTEASEARQTVHQRAIAGGRPVRRDRDYNRIMLEVAAAHGVPVVDGGRALDQRPGDYIDFCHFNAAGHRKIGELLAAQITTSLSGEWPPAEPSLVFPEVIDGSD